MNCDFFDFFDYYDGTLDGTCRGRNPMLRVYGILVEIKLVAAKQIPGKQRPHLLSVKSRNP
jgi:hypothetical protein